MLNNQEESYGNLIGEVVSVIESARYEAYSSINKHSISLNFEIGKLIVNAQELNSWGKSIVENISNDLRKLISGKKGFSSQNLWKMRQFYLEYKDYPKLKDHTLKVPWSHNLLIMTKIESFEAREFYLKAVHNFGWSRAVLLNQIKSAAFERQVISGQNNFEAVLPVHLKEQATEALKSEYNLDFLGVTGPLLERELESKLIDNVKDLIMELGYGFCYIGNQYKINLKQKEYFIDLLFYHRILKCLIVIDIKTVEFTPEFAGKMNFYLELVDDQLKQNDDNPSIGIILCPEKDDFEVEYALKSIRKPIGVSEYKLTNKLPEDLKGKLPTSSEFKRLFKKR